jgi:regulator of protease activity HflC (stomatin/prohibitin superfamily)
MSTSLFSQHPGVPDDFDDTEVTRIATAKPMMLRVMRIGGKTAAFLVLFIVLTGLLLWQRVVYIVPAGGAGVLYRTLTGGTVTDYVYGEGVHIVLPWDRFTIYDTRVQVVLSEFTALTNKGLPIQLRLAIRYHPEYSTVGLLHQRVGPDYVAKIVQPQVESVLRRYIGKEAPEAIYTNKEGVLSSIISRAIEEISEQFVTIDDIIIREVTLPEQLREAITTKLAYQQQEEAYEFRIAGEQREAERKRIEAEGIAAAQKIISSGLNQDLLRWEAIRVQGDLAKSPNSKTVIMNGTDAGRFNFNVP